MKILNSMAASKKTYPVKKNLPEVHKIQLPLSNLKFDYHLIYFPNLKKFLRGKSAEEIKSEIESVTVRKLLQTRKWLELLSI